MKKNIYLWLFFFARLCMVVCGIIIIILLCFFVFLIYSISHISPMYVLVFVFIVRLLCFFSVTNSKTLWEKLRSFLFWNEMKIFLLICLEFFFSHSQFWIKFVSIVPRKVNRTQSILKKAKIDWTFMTSFDDIEMAVNSSTQSYLLW